MGAIALLLLLLVVTSFDVNSLVIVVNITDDIRMNVSSLVIFSYLHTTYEQSLNYCMPTGVTVGV